MKQHVESRYVTDAYATIVATICGRNIRRDHTSRFKSAAGEGRRYGRVPCIQCQERTES